MQNAESREGGRGGSSAFALLRRDISPVKPPTLKLRRTGVELLNEEGRTPNEEKDGKEG
jgi:hypothetical protein